MPLLPLRPRTTSFPRVLKTSFGLLLGSSSLLLAYKATVPAQEAGPLREYRLEVDGKQQTVELDKEFALTVGDSKVMLRLTAAPDLLLEMDDFEIRYPANFAYEYDDTSEGITIWSLDGSTCVLMVMTFDVEQDPKSLKDDLVQGFTAQYGRKNVKLKKCSLRLGAKKNSGTRLTVSMLDQKFTQEVYTFSHGGRSHALVVQDTPTDKGKQSKETADAKELLEDSFTLSGE